LKGEGMGLSDKVKGLSSNVQDGVKASSVSLFCFTLRFITGVMLGLTMALIGQELLGYGSLAMLFGMVVVIALVLKTTSEWSVAKILIFDLILVLVAMLLRMYILVAP
jgi:hypothetical protein